MADEKKPTEVLPATKSAVVDKPKQDTAKQDATRARVAELQKEIAALDARDHGGIVDSEREHLDRPRRERLAQLREELNSLRVA